MIPKQRLETIRTIGLLFLVVCASHTNALAQKSGQQLIDSLVSVLPTLADDSTKAKTLNRIAGQYRRLSRKEEADYLHQELELSRKINYPLGIAESTLQLGAFYAGKSDYHKGLTYLQESASVFHNLKSFANEATAYTNIAANYQGQDKLNLAMDNFKKAIEIDDRDKRWRASAKSKANLGGVLYLLGKYNEAMDTLSSAINKLDTALDKRNIAAANNNIGNIYSKKGDYPKAYSYYLKALGLQQQLSLKGAAAQTMGFIAQNFYYQNDYHKSIEYSEKALKLYEQLNDTRQMGRIYYQMSISYADLGAEKNKLEYLHKSHEIAQKVQDKRALAAVATSLGIHYKLKGDFRKAIEYYDEAMKLNSALGNRRGQSVDLINLGGLYRDSPDSTVQMTTAQRLAKAKSLLLDALAQVQASGDKDLEKNALDHLAALYKEENDFERAYMTYMKFSELKDSMINDETNKAVARKEIQFEFLKKEDSLKFAKQLTDEQLKQQVLLTQQQTLLADKRRQELLLNEANIELLTKEKAMQSLAFEKTEAELAAEQSQRLEQEKQLVISNQEKTIQQSQLRLRTAELSAKDSEIINQRQTRNLYIAGFGLALISLFFIFRNYRNKQAAKQKLAAEKLKTQKAEAVRRMAEFEMHGLRAQLNPHFMFNALNAIHEQILKEDTDNAGIYLTTFARMLRQLLENAEHAFVPLIKELDFLKLYLTMEQLRMPELEFDFVVDPAIDVQTTMIPNMILQPYLENAIWHGLSPKAGEKRISVKVRQLNDSIDVEVTDNGVGREKSAELKSKYRKAHKSKGMELLQKRFELIRVEFGSHIKIDVEDLTEENKAAGTKVSLQIPMSFSDPMLDMRETVLNN